MRKILWVAEISSMDSGKLQENATVLLYTQHPVSNQRKQSRWFKENTPVGVDCAKNVSQRKYLGDVSLFRNFSCLSRSEKISPRLIRFKRIELFSVNLEWTALMVSFCLRDVADVDDAACCGSFKFQRFKSGISSENLLWMSLGSNYALLKLLWLEKRLSCRLDRIANAARRFCRPRMSSSAIFMCLRRCFGLFCRFLGITVEVTWNWSDSSSIG